jgi:predicted alpha-1,6-mannanase (GH76 family)
MEQQFSWWWTALVAALLGCTGSGTPGGAAGDGGPAGAGPGDVSGLSVTRQADQSLCRLSADGRFLVVRVQNGGPDTTTGATVEVSTDETPYKLRQDLPPLANGQTIDLSFDRAPLVGFTESWSFTVAIAPGAPAAAKGQCSDLRSRAVAGMVPLTGWYNATSGLWSKAVGWIDANFLETSVSYARETGDPSYASLIDNTFTKASGKRFLNDYYDDEGWWTLTWIKAFDLTHQQKYLDMAKAIFKDLTLGWSPAVCGGGLFWRKSTMQKNAIPNELFLTAAARLHLRTPGDEGPDSYLDWAMREWAWFKASGMINGQNQIVDGMNFTTCIAGGTIYTYNQGVILGGLVDLWRSTGDVTLLDTAEAIARAAMKNLADPNGVLIEKVCDPKCGEGDGLLFVGILARNLGYFYEARPLAELQTFLLRQSDALWNDNRNAMNQFGKRWPGPFDSADYSRQGCALEGLIAAIKAGNMNLALGKPATGSDGCLPAQGPDRAVDGAARWDSKWCAPGLSGQTLQIDLGKTQTVVGFRVRHAGAGGESPDLNTRAFEIQVSTDGTTWMPAVAVTNNTADVTTHPIVGTDARYVRLHVTSAQTATDTPAARIYELEVFGMAL